MPAQAAQPGGRPQGRGLPGHCGCLSSTPHALGWTRARASFAGREGNARCSRMARPPPGGSLKTCPTVGQVRAVRDHTARGVAVPAGSGAALLVPRPATLLKVASPGVEGANSQAYLEEVLPMTTATPRNAPAVLPGPNDACWCGSGSKYKKCHRGADTVEARRKGADTNRKGIRPGIVGPRRVVPLTIGRPDYADLGEVARAGCGARKLPPGLSRRISTQGVGVLLVRMP